MHLTKKVKNRLTVGLMLVFVLFWFYLFVFVGPESIIVFFGTEFIYLSIFILALIGSFTSLTTFSIYPALILFASGGLNPFLLTVVAGAGLTLGDLFFFLLGGRLKSVLGKRSATFFEKYFDIDNKYLPVFIYFYVGFTPFPNNLLTIWLALKGLSLKKLFVPLMLGDLSFVLIVSLAVKYGFISL